MHTHRTATLTLNSATGVIAGTDKGDIKANGTFNLSANKAEIYLYVFPEELANIKIIASDGTRMYEGTLADKNLDAGKVYTAKVTMNAGPYIYYRDIIREDLSSGSGTADNPYVISNAKQLRYFISNITNVYQKYFRLDTDIYINEDVNWSSYICNATFDGNSHKILGTLNCTSATNGNAGFFAQINNGATVKNLIIDADVISATSANIYSTGGVAGGTSGPAKIINCTVNGNVTGINGTNGAFYSAGIIGSLGSGGEITNCHFNGTVTGTSGMIGGLTGYNMGTIYQCSSSTFSPEIAGGPAKVPCPAGNDHGHN